MKRRNISSFIAAMVVAGAVLAASPAHATGGAMDPNGGFFAWVMQWFDGEEARIDPNGDN